MTWGNVIPTNHCSDRLGSLETTYFSLSLGVGIFEIWPGEQVQIVLVS